MCAIVKFPKHKLINCRGRQCVGCPACEWNAAICSTCGGAEACLPTHCPQERMTGWQFDQVQAGRLDFVDGDWHVRSSRTSSTFIVDDPFVEIK